MSTPSLAGRSTKLYRSTLVVALGISFVGNAFAVEEATIDFVVERSDTLIGLSRTVLASPAAWREVAKLNKLRSANRIRPGQHLLIPARLMRSEAVDATLVSVSGDVQVGDAPAVAGTIVGEGQRVQTGVGSSAVIALADGSRVRLPPSSLAEVETSRNYSGRVSTGADAGGASSPWFAGTLRVLRGSIEVFATQVLRAKPLEVVTPTAVVGVRGTQYRVGFDESADGRTHGEVIEGAVRFDVAGDVVAGNVVAADAGADKARATPRGAEIARGFGAAADAKQTEPIVARLLAPPDLSTLPERFERPIVRFTVPGEPTPLRVQVAADAGFDRLVVDQVSAAGAEVRIAGLDDAPWYLRARRIDPNGIEGLDAMTRPFILKARPEPPAYSAPRVAGKQAVGSVEFAWAPNAEATRVRLQVAEDPAFTRVLHDRDNLDAASLRIEIAQPGVYHWRLASVRPSGDHGPFGDPQTFELRPDPAPPKASPSADGKSLVFAWNGRAEDRQQVELARDAEFTEIVTTKELTGSEWTLPVPSRGGRYYFRYRSVEPDGFVSPYSAKLIVDVPRDWRGLGLLLPLLLLL